MGNDEKRNAKYRLAKQWMQNRPWMRYDITPHGVEYQNRRDGQKFRVRLQYHRLTDGTWITVREHIGFSVKRSMVKVIEQMQGRELTPGDVEVRR